MTRNAGNPEEALAEALTLSGFTVRSVPFGSLLSPASDESGAKAGPATALGFRLVRPSLAGARSVAASGSCLPLASPDRSEIANSGTLFLDEIGNLSLPLQSKLLTALQNKQVTRVGSNKAIRLDIRLVCATNLPLYQMVEEKRFRQDLLYRVNTVEIKLPPLRERPEDLPLLADHFVHMYARKHQRPVLSVSALALTKLGKYSWPGNVRELQHTIERAVILGETDVLQPEDFLLTGKAVKPEGFVIDEYNLEELEKLLIRKALDKFAGNISHAAKELGLTRASLYRRLEKYGL